MNKAGITIGIILIIAGIVAMCGCTSETPSSSYSSSSGSSDYIKTANYDEDTGITSGTTKDGYGYAYSDDGKTVAVSDGDTTVVSTTN